MLAVYAAGHTRIYLHEPHVDRNAIQRFRTVLMFTLTSSTKSKRNMIRILFLHLWSVAEVFDVC